MSETLSQRIVKLLSAHSEPLTASFISFSLSDYSFDEVCSELGQLQEAGVVSLDYSGYILKENHESLEDEPAESTPSTVSEESEQEPTKVFPPAASEVPELSVPVVEVVPMAPAESKSNEPTVDIVQTASAAAEQDKPGPVAPAVDAAPTALPEPAPREPKGLFPSIVSVLQLDKRFKDFLAEHRQNAAKDDAVEKDEPSADEIAFAAEKDVPPTAEPVSTSEKSEPFAAEPVSTVEENERPTLEPIPAVEKDGLVAAESFPATETSGRSFVPEAVTPIEIDSTLVDEAPDNAVSSSIDIPIEDKVPSTVEASPEVATQTNEEVSPAAEPPAEEVLPMQPEESEASVPTPEEASTIGQAAPRQRLDYGDLLDELERAGHGTGLEVFSDLPFIGAPRTAPYDEKELLYAKLSGTKAGEGLDEYPDEPIIGVPEPVIDEVDREYRSMLAEFSSQDTDEENRAEKKGSSSVIPSRDRTQERDEYRDLLAMLFFDTSDSAGGDADAQADITDGSADKESSSAEATEEPAAPEVLTYRSPASVLELSGRPLNIFLRYDIDSLEKLVREIDTLYKKPGVGFLSYESVVNALNAHAAHLPTGIDIAQQQALSDASGSKMFVFDIFGRLCRVEHPETPADTPADSEDTAVEDTIDATDKFEQIKDLPIERLNLTPQLRAVLRRKGCRTVGQAAALSDKELLAERGIGNVAVVRLRDSIDELDVHGQPSEKTSNQTGTSILLEDKTPILDIELPNRLKHALVHAGHRTIGEVAALSEGEILSLRGVGALAAERLNEVLLELEQSKTKHLMELASLHVSSETPSSGSAQESESPKAAFSGTAHPSAFQGVQQALEICRQRQYPIYENSFSACMPLSVVQNVGDGHSAEEYCSAAIEVIEGSDDLISICEDVLRAEVEQARSLESATHMAAPIPIPTTPEWEEAAQHIDKDDKWCLYHGDEHMLELRHPSLDDWIESSVEGERDRDLLRMYLGGSTLQECGEQFNLTREGVRQIATRELKKVTLVEEDRYRHLLDTYSISKNDFLAATGEPIGTYIYLHLTRKERMKRLALSKALRDELVPQTAREGIRRILDKGYVYADGARILMRKEAILTHVVMRHASDRYIKADELRRIYEQFLTDNHLEDIKALQFASTRNLEACIDRYEQIMRLPHNTEGKFGGSIRYYDALAMDFDPLRQMLLSADLGNVECSAAMLVNDERFANVLEELDIRNEYELHYILGRYCGDIEGMTMGRTPTVSFGKGNRHDQILDMIKELSPVSSGDLAKAYEERYGIDVAIFQGSYLNDFKIYLRHGKYVYNNQGLSAEQKAFISQQLKDVGRDYMSTSLVKARFRDRFPDASTSLINAKNIAELGFHPSASLLVRNGIDERTLFGNLLDSKQRFSIDDEDLGKDVFDNQAFQAELAIRERAYRLVEFEKGSYLSTRMFASLDEPLYEDDLRDYVEHALDHMAPNRPYTVQSLIASGFRHKLDTLRDDFGLGDYFYASLLATGTVGGRLKTTSFADVPVFCRTLYSYSAPIMMEQILSAVEAIDIDELSYLLEDEYGISANNALLRMIAKRADLYYSESLDMVFDSVETYRRKAQEWIS